MSTDEITPKSSTDTDQTNPEPDTLFQQRILFIISGYETGRYRNESYSHEGAYGLGIKRTLEETMDEEVNHGRLYPNLDDLVEKGLIEKRAIDKRTNGYQLTEAGRNYLLDELQWGAGCLDVDREAIR